MFWGERGCDAVSIQDLVDTLDLNRGSLYGTYGDKEQLWQRALTRYCEQRTVHLAAHFDDPTEPVLPRVRLLMLELADPNAELPRGCLRVRQRHHRTHRQQCRPWTSPSDTSTMWKTYCAKLSPELARAERSTQHRLRDSSPASWWSCCKVCTSTTVRWPIPDEPATRSRSPCRVDRSGAVVEARLTRTNYSTRPCSWAATGAVFPVGEGGLPYLQRLLPV